MEKIEIELPPLPPPKLSKGNSISRKRKDSREQKLQLDINYERKVIPYSGKNVANRQGQYVELNGKQRLLHKLVEDNERFVEDRFPTKLPLMDSTTHSHEKSENVTPRVSFVSNVQVFSFQTSEVQGLHPQAPETLRENRRTDERFSPPRRGQKGLYRGRRKNLTLEEATEERKQRYDLLEEEAHQILQEVASRRYQNSRGLFLGKIRSFFACTCEFVD
jgi:hypothetical protein